MVIGIDFDNTICDRAHPEPGHRLGPPFPGAKERILQLKKDGHQIIIHSRNRPEVIRQWMQHFGIPFDSIWGEKRGDVGKPPADLFLDDSAVRFIAWDRLGPDPATWA